MKRSLGLMTMAVLVGGYVGCSRDNGSPTAPPEEIISTYDGQALEVGTEKWDNGKASVEYQYFLDTEGKPVLHGWYKRYDENGILRVSGTFYEGKEKYHGKWIAYNEFGKVMWEHNYADGKREGTWLRYDDSGKVAWEASYVNGMLDGKESEYDENGKVKNETSYVDGKLEGKEFEYNENGKVITETSYVDGK